MKLAIAVNEKSFLDNLNATRVIATTVGVLFGIAGMNHGFFEVLQGNKAADGLIIQAIGEAQRFWVLGTEDALTIIPNYLISGVLAMALGAAIVIWSIWFLPTKHGPTIFLGLFILLFLSGGGIGQLIFFIPAWYFATQIEKPRPWWCKVLPPRSRPFLSRLWPVTLILATSAMVVGLEMAIFGYFPGLTEAQTIQNTALLFVLAAAVLYVISFIAGIGHELRRLNMS